MRLEVDLGHELAGPSLVVVGERKALGVTEDAVRLRFVACPMIEIASRELRRAIQDGLSIRYLVPRAVEEYARERKLYTAGA